MIEYTKDIGNATTSREPASRCSPTAALTTENMSTANPKELENIPGHRASPMKESGSMGSNMAQACGAVSKGTAMSANGGWGRPKAMAFMSG